MSENKKTAIELLEEMLIKQDQILGYLRNIDFSQKALLANANKSNNQTDIVKQQIAKKKEELLDNLKMETSSEPTPRRREPIKNQTELVNVWQKLVTEEGGPIFLAAVEFINENGEMVKKARTDANGTWKTSLSPGMYTVSVVKQAKPGSGKQGYSITYEILVPEGEALVNLDYQVVKGN